MHIINKFNSQRNQQTQENNIDQQNLKFRSSTPLLILYRCIKSSFQDHITFQSSQQYHASLQNQWLHSCIGLVLCELHQNNQTLYVYGTGTLIHKSIVLTSAQNVYCRRLNKQYANIRFLVGVSGDKCSEIYDVMRIHYPKEYTIQEEYDNYNFAMLQLYDDLSDSCGYIGWKTMVNIESDEEYTIYGYISGNQQGSFDLRQIKKYQKKEYCQEDYLGSGVIVKENKDKCSVVGLQSSEKTYILNEKIRNRIYQWTEQTQINLYNNNIDAQGREYLNESNWIPLTTIDLSQNGICAQGCKYLSLINWIHLTNINLESNSIGEQGCKYLSQADWTHLTQINLYDNNIGAQGCKYLSQTNWPHLTQISLSNNNIGAQGCKYLSSVNWIRLASINLHANNINAQGCKYLTKVNWIHLKQLNLNYNNIDTQGCKYLSQTNWIHLTYIYLNNNNINAQGCKYLNQTNWIHLTTIYLQYNSICAQGYKYLSQTQWMHLNRIDLNGNNMNDIIYRLLLQQSYLNITIQV